MRIDIQCVHCVVNGGIIERIREKLDRISQKYDWVIEARVIIKIVKSARDRDKVVEIILYVPKNKLFAKGQEETFTLAVTEAVKGIQQQLDKYKERILPRQEKIAQQIEEEAELSESFEVWSMSTETESKSAE